MLAFEDLIFFLKKIHFNPFKVIAIIILLLIGH